MEGKLSVIAEVDKSYETGMTLRLMRERLETAEREKDIAIELLEKHADDSELRENETWGQAVLLMRLGRELIAKQGDSDEV